MRAILARLKLVADQAEQLHGGGGGGALHNDAAVAAAVAHAKRRQSFLFLIDSVLNRIKQVRRGVGELSTSQMSTMVLKTHLLPCQALPSVPSIQSCHQRSVQFLHFGRVNSHNALVYVYVCTICSTPRAPPWHYRRIPSNTASGAATCSAASARSLGCP